MQDKRKEYFSFLSDAYKRHINSGISWGDLTNEFNELFGENITKNSFRKRCTRYSNADDKKEFENNVKFGGGQNEKKAPKSVEFSGNVNIHRNVETVDIDGNGVLTAQRIIEYQQEVFGDKKKLLKYLGYDPSEWNVQHLSIKRWEQGMKDGGTKNLCSVGLKLDPVRFITKRNVLDGVKELMKKEITPYTLKEAPVNKELNPDKMMEFCPVELHMGKLSNDDETGENYDIKIAQRIFEDIVQKTCQLQKEKKCNKLLVVVGSDFFNSESDNCTSNNKIPQQNDTRFRKLYITGSQLYIKALLTFRNLFNEIEVRLCPGNHARATEFYMYYSLLCRFHNDDVITFVEDYKDTQAIRWGKCAIFYNHGDADLKRTIKSMPAEFYDIWGKTIYRELHLGHLHKEVTVDDDGGMITRRIGSPCATDAWHYQNRFVGATKKHQVFIWDKNDGLCEMDYINIKLKDYDR